MIHPARLLLLILPTLMVAPAAFANSAPKPGATGARLEQATAPPVLDAQELSPARPVRDWYERHAEGWFWRDVDPEPVDEDPEIPEKAVATTPSIRPETLYPSLDQPIDDPLARLEQLQQAIETSKALAVLQPTPDNIRDYIAIQHEVMEKSGLFADNWVRVMWQNPQYDYGQIRPTQPVALSTYKQQYAADRNAALRAIAQEYGLYFIVAGSCPYCHAMGPYLKRWAERYGFTVIAVSIDGGSVKEYPNAMYSPEFAEQLGVKTTPAIILAKPSEGIVVPVSYGFVDVRELETRIYRLFELEPGQLNYQVESSTAGDG